MSSKPTGKPPSHWPALLLMLCGLGVLVAQQMLPDKSWTESQQQEFKELQMQLHRTPNKAPVKERDARDSRLYTQMNALEMSRINQQNDTASRERWLRIIGLSLLCGGLGLYFARQAGND